MFKNILKKIKKNKLEKNTINHNGIFHIDLNPKYYTCNYTSTEKGGKSNLLNLSIIARKKALRKKILNF